MTLPQNVRDRKHRCHQEKDNQEVNTQCPEPLGLTVQQHRIRGHPTRIVLNRCEGQCHFPEEEFCAGDAENRSLFREIIISRVGSCSQWVVRTTRGHNRNEGGFWLEGGIRQRHKQGWASPAL